MTARYKRQHYLDVNGGKEDFYPALQVNPFEIRPGEVTNQWMSENKVNNVSDIAAETFPSFPIL